VNLLHEASTQEHGIEEHEQAKNFRFSACKTECGHHTTQWMSQAGFRSRCHLLIYRQRVQFMAESLERLKASLDLPVERLMVGE
jgi:predicted DCC family thiol-disulfide oxidoreductase YuxK